MEYAYLGKTGMLVSRLCLGTAAFGQYSGGFREYGGVDEAEAFRIMDAAVDAGINFFDTANVYGGYDTRGSTEEIIGRWFAKGGNRRERVILATKVGRAFEQDKIDGPNAPAGLSLYKIRRHFAASLRRLQTDHIELYQMHHAYPHVTWDELWEAFEGLVRSGQIDYIGSCNFEPTDLVEAQLTASRRGYMGLVSEQLRYGLLDRGREHDVIATAAKLEMGVMAWSPMARGILALDMSKPVPETLSGDGRALLAKHEDKIKAFSELCHDLGEPEPVVAMAWILANPVLTAPIIGPSSVEELESTLRATEITLDESTLQRLDEIFPAGK